MRCEMCGIGRDRLTAVFSRPNDPAYGTRAMVCEACAKAFQTPVWLRRQRENGARDLTGQIRSDR